MSLVKNEILESFDAMWGKFPAPVMLIHSSREVLAVNDFAKDLGISNGIKCHSLYPSDKPCPGCLANKALKNDETVRKCTFDKRTGIFYDGYWIPVKGEKDIYVHYGADITEFVKPELLEK